MLLTVSWGNLQSNDKTASNDAGHHYRLEYYAIPFALSICTALEPYVGRSVRNHAGRLCGEICLVWYSGLSMSIFEDFHSSTQLSPAQQILVRIWMNSPREQANFCKNRVLVTIASCMVRLVCLVRGSTCWVGSRSGYSNVTSHIV